MKRFLLSGMIPLGLIALVYFIIQGQLQGIPVYIVLAILGLGIIKKAIRLALDVLSLSLKIILFVIVLTAIII